ncbi:MAG: hemolysin family protein [Deltaproteobacteria bacterium]|nr:hemolysin family protein [Deltaproteobacteria bacterium]
MVSSQRPAHGPRRCVLVAATSHGACGRATTRSTNETFDPLAHSAGRCALSPLQAASLAVLCIVLAALVAAAEAAITSLPAARLMALRDELGSARSTHLSRYLRDPVGLLSRWLSFRIAMLVIATQLVSNDPMPGQTLAARMGIVAALVIFYTTVVEVFGALARSRASEWVPRALAVTRPVDWIMSPVGWPIALLAGRAVKWFPGPLVDPETTKHMAEREVEYVVEAAENAGVIDSPRGEIMQNVLEFKDVTVRDVMVPRTQVQTLPATTTLSKALAMVSEDGHSRIPVYDGTVDNVVGVLHAKDLFRVMSGSLEDPSRKLPARATVLSVVRKPVLQVSPSQLAMSLLREMQSRHQHMAIVIDHFGGLSGIVTLEDLLEELVGDIADEHDEEEPDIVEHEDGRIVVVATIAIAELEDKLGVDFPSDADYASLGGFLADQSGRVPVPSTIVTWMGFVFTVCEGDARRATKVEIVREVPSTTEPATK